MLIGGLVLFAASPLIGKSRAVPAGGCRHAPYYHRHYTHSNSGQHRSRRQYALCRQSSGLRFDRWQHRADPYHQSVEPRFLAGLVPSLSPWLSYLISIPLGLANLSVVINAAWFQIPRIEPYGWFVWPQTSGLIIVIVYHLVAAIYTMSITLALCKMLGVEGTEKRVRGAVAADGLGSAIAVLFGGVPLISYDQNVGAISLTGVASRFVVAVAGVILIVMALVPKIGALIAIVPPFVLGGTLIFMFGMIAAVGVGILADSMRSQRDLLLFAASLGLAIAVDFAPPSLFDQVTPSLRFLPRMES